MKLVNSCVLLVLSLFALNAKADLHFLVDTGLHFGGDELASVSFVGGNNESIDAGGLISGTIGVETPLAESFSLRVAGGIKFDIVTAENGEIDFTRYILNALLMYKLSDDWHVGIGATQHSGVEFTGDGFASGLDVQFDDATGALLAFEYQLNERAFLGARFTSIEYTESMTGGVVDGSSIGVVIGYRFGQ